MIKFYSVLITALFIFSCKSASKLYDQGNYEDAVAVAVKKLQKDPNDGETKALLQKAYAYAINRHEEQIRNLSSGSSDSRYEKILQEYRQLQDLYEIVQQNPGSASAVKAVDYSSYVQTYREKAAEIHLDKAMRWMEEAATKSEYREAYKEFRIASKYRPDNMDIRKKMEQAYDASLVKVVIEPIDPYRFGYSNNNYIMRTFQEDLLRNLSFQAGNEFVKFYSAWDAQSGKIQPDEILNLHFGRMDIGHPYDQQSSRQVSKDVVIKEIVYKPDSVVKQYGKVYAQITTTQRTMISEGELFVTSRDLNGRVLWNDVFRGEHRWQVQFATYTGDERALSETDKSAINNRSNYILPTEDEILRQVLQQIQNEMQYRLKNYFSRY